MRLCAPQRERSPLCSLRGKYLGDPCIPERAWKRAAEVVREDDAGARTRHLVTSSLRSGAGVRALFTGSSVNAPISCPFQSQVFLRVDLCPAQHRGQKDPKPTSDSNHGSQDDVLPLPPQRLLWL